MNPDSRPGAKFSREELQAMKEDLQREAERLRSKAAKDKAERGQAVIFHGTPEHRRYWKAWYLLELPPIARRDLHKQWGLPISHTTWGAVELATWERRCTEKLRERLIAECRAMAQKLPEMEVRKVNAEMGRGLRIKPGAKLEDLTVGQLRTVLLRVKALCKKENSHAERSGDDEERADS